jgi:hypothetical protein
MASFLIVSVIAGLVGAAAMEGVMFLITRAQWAKANMVTALGGLVSRRRENAFRVGALVHALAAVGFALLYNYAMRAFGLAAFPVAFFVGIGFGFLHGFLVSLTLVWVVSDTHPFEEYREAGFAVGVAHLAGHVAYGAGVGLVIALGATLR